MIKNRKAISALLVALLICLLFIGTKAVKSQETKSLTLVLKTNVSPDQSKSSEVVALQMRRIGINVQVLPLDFTTFYSHLYDNRDFDLYLMAHGSYPFPKYMVQWFNSELDVTPGGSESNHFGFHNDTMDSLLDELWALSSDKVEEAKEIMNEIQIVYAQNLPHIPTKARDSVQYIRKEWEGYENLAGVQGIFSIYNPWSMVNITLSANPGYGNFKMCVTSDTETLNPYVANNHRSQFIRMLLWDTLVKYDSDWEEIVPYMAESWEVSSDGLTWTFHLRDNLKWHDGQPITSDDVKFTFDFIIEQDIPDYATDFAVIDSIDTPDPHTAVFHLKNTFFWFLPTLTETFILPKHIWEGQKWNMDISSPVASGPFKFSTWTRGEYLELDKNDDWWMEGHPRIDKFSWIPIPTVEGRLMSVRSGATDADRYEAWTGMAVLDVRLSPELNTLTTTSVLGYQYLAFNMRKSPMNESSFRRAIALAMDHQEIGDIVYLGYATPLHNCIAKTFYAEWYNPEVENYLAMEPDLEMANQLLDELGYIDVNGDGMRDMPVGEPEEATDWTWYYVGGIIVAVVVITSVAFFLRRKK